MAMEFVDGQPIIEYTREQELSLPQKLGLFKAVCGAIAHAHANLVLHRDIKSDNILVDADGRIKLIDFGIATLLDDDTATDTGPFTLATAAPEQLNGQAISVQSDIFALGVLLHDLVTDKLPEREADGSVSLHPSLTDNKDLEAITAKALATDPQNRYPSADALEAEIEAYLTQYPVAARNGGSLYKISKFVRRTPVATALGSAFLAALVIGLGTTTYYANEATQEANRANEEAIRANAETKKAKELLARAKWSAEQEFTQYQIATTYSDAMQRSLGQQETDRVTEYLLDYVAESDLEDKDNPEQRALKRFAVGKHFLNRNDYIRSRQVLEPWIKENYGSPDMLRFGSAILGFAYRNTGDKALAIDAFRTSAALSEGTFAEGSPDHASAMLQAAILSESEADMDKAGEVVEKLLEKETNPQMRMYFQNQVFRIERKRGNWDTAYNIMAKVVEDIDNNLSSEMAGQDTNRMNLADMEVYHRGDYAAAEKQIQIVMDMAEGDKGESMVLGRALELQAAIDRKLGNLESANSNTSKALVIYEKYIGKSALYIDAAVLRGMIMADQGHITRSKDMLDMLNSLSPEETQHWAALLKLYVDLSENGPGNAGAMIEKSGLNLDEAHSSVKLNFYLKDLQDQGLNISVN